jgi:hydroxypyruvate reductase
MKPYLLLIGPLYAPTMELLAREHTLLRYDEAENKHKFLMECAPLVRAAATRGDYRIDRSLLEQLPRLEIIASYGVGYEGIDVAAAAELGIAVTHTPDVLTNCVADTAFALILSTVRRIASYDRYVRAGRWESGPAPLTGKVWGERLGILGLGRIGREIALRAEAFRMDISYHNRHRRSDIAYRYFDNPVDLARNVDILVVVTPGGPGTHHIVDRHVIDAIGPSGYLVNLSRASAVDETYLIESLKCERLAGAALDAYVDSPRVPEELMALDNVVLMPHVGSATLHARNAMGQLVADNLSAYFAGRPLLSQVAAKL